MTRVLWIGLPLTALIGTAAVLGVLAGRNAELSETEAIEAVAAEWVARGGARTGCAAVPGVGAVWLVVRCGAGEAALVRQLDRSGRAVAGGGT